MPYSRQDNTFGSEQRGFVIEQQTLQGGKFDTLLFSRHPPYPLKAAVDKNACRIPAQDVFSQNLDLVVMETHQTVTAQKVA